MSEIKHCRLLILGTGPAGYTAAVYADSTAMALFYEDGVGVD